MVESQGASTELRVMLDANVLIAGSVWPRWSYEVIQQGLQGSYQLVLIPLVIAQARRRVTQRFPRQLALFETFLAHAGTIVAPDPLPSRVVRNRGLVRDQTDVPIALAAIDARVAYLISEDKDFTADDETTARLRNRLHVLRPVIFLRDVLGWTSETLEQVRRRTWRDLLPPPNAE